MLNTVYALLMERADATDRVMAPVFLAAGADSRKVGELSRRDAVDSWIDAPDAETADGYAALVAELTGRA